MEFNSDSNNSHQDEQLPVQLSPPPPPYEEAIATSSSSSSAYQYFDQQRQQYITIHHNHHHNINSNNSDNNNNDAILRQFLQLPLPLPLQYLPTTHLSHIQTAPPYSGPRRQHYFASSEEELAALQEFARIKTYITPGTEGSLSVLGGVMPSSGPGPVPAPPPVVMRRRMTAPTIERDGGYNELNLTKEQLRRERLEMLESMKREKEARQKQKEEAKARAKAKAQAKAEAKAEAKAAAAAAVAAAAAAATATTEEQGSSTGGLLRVGDRVGLKLKQVLRRASSAS